MQTAHVPAESSLFMEPGEPDSLPADSPVSEVSAVRPRVNAHIHLPPNFSAFDTVAQAVDLAADQDVRILGASNYYDFRVYSEFAALALRRGVFPLFGIEIISLLGDLEEAGIRVNDPVNPGKMYLCGKGIALFDPMSEEAAGLLAVVREKDSERMNRMTTRLALRFSSAGLETGIDAIAVKKEVVGRHGCPEDTVYLQERHVAQSFQEAVFQRLQGDERAALLLRAFGAPAAAPEDAAGVQSEIRSLLMKAGKPAYVEETFVGFDHARRLILALGGIPSYPTLADGASTICQFETPVTDLINAIVARGVYAAELIPIRNSPDQLVRYVEALRSAGLVVTAGTEHNTRDMLPLEPTCVDGQPIPVAIQEIFWEGACVIAAHQHLVLRGEQGYVDSEGRLNSAYGSGDARIAAFRDLGADVILDYQRTAGGWR